MRDQGSLTEKPLTAENAESKAEIQRRAESILIFGVTATQL
jgi:hypothetical protein